MCKSEEEYLVRIVEEREKAIDYVKNGFFEQHKKEMPRELVDLADTTLDLIVDFAKKNEIDQIAVDSLVRQLYEAEEVCGFITPIAELVETVEQAKEVSGDFANVPVCVANILLCMAETQLAYYTKIGVE